MAANFRTALIQPKTAAFLSLGCKVNQTENESLAELFRQAGYGIVETSERPRALIINTCSVTAAAAGKSRRLIRRVVREHPESVVAVMGCFSQLEAEAVRALGPHIVIGTQQRRSLVTHVETILNQDGVGSICCVLPYDRVAEDAAAPAQETARVPFEELPRLQQEKHVRATIKIQDGCSQLCAYCSVPAARGPARSRQPERVLAEVNSLLAHGYREIILTGIHLGCYGRDCGLSLAGLLDRIADVPGLLRLRLSSVESTDIDAALLEVLAAHRDIICPHFHIPLQSGSDSVLARMHRPYGRTDYLRVLKEIRLAFPDAAITTDIMAGFPGETDADAAQSLAMIRECAFADVHAFGFSARPGTPAAAMPEQVDPAVKAARVKDLIEAGRKSRAAYLQNFYGRTLEVLWERVDATGARGHTRNYIHVAIPASQCAKTWRSGDTAQVTLTPSLVADE